MKKIFSILLSFAMVLGMGSVALAEVTTPTEEKQNVSEPIEVLIKKVYKLENPETSSPQETFEFTIAPKSVTDAGNNIEGKKIIVDNMPMPVIEKVSYDKGAASVEGKEGKIIVKLPVYESVGIYTYIINETNKKQAGVTYFGGDITLVVTVTQEEPTGLKATAAVHTENSVSPKYGDDPETAESTKSDEFENKYSAGKLMITKEVTGILGDREKFFDVNVKLTGVEGETYEGSYPVTGGSNEANPDTIKVGTSTGFKIKDGETIEIANLPYGVTYTVVEADYTGVGEGKGYDSPKYEFSNKVVGDKKIISAKETVTITNNKGGNVDTGISLDSIPYIMILGLAVLGISALFLRRRKNANF